MKPSLAEKKETKAEHALRMRRTMDSAAGWLMDIRTNVEEVPFIRVGATEKPLGEGFVTREDLVSIYALLAYQADRMKIHRGTLEAALKARFNVRKITRIRERDANRAVEYLIDLKPKGLRH